MKRALENCARRGRSSGCDASSQTVPATPRRADSTSAVRGILLKTAFAFSRSAAALRATTRRGVAGTVCDEASQPLFRRPPTSTVIPKACAPLNIQLSPRRPSADFSRTRISTLNNP